MTAARDAETGEGPGDEAPGAGTPGVGTPVLGTLVVPGRTPAADENADALRARVAELQRANRQLQDLAAELAAANARLQERAAAGGGADAARARAAGLLARMADAHAVLDAEFRVVDVNAAMERGVGCGRAALVGRSIWELFPALVGTDAERFHRQVAESGVEAHAIFPYADGRLDLVAEVDAYPADDGGLAVFWRDVTARVRAVRALRASEAKYRALFEAADQGFGIAEILVDAAGRPVDYRMLEINPQFERLTGQSREQYLAGRTVREVAPELEAHWYAFYGNVALTGEPARAEIHAEGWDRWFEVSAYRVGEPGARQVAILFTDVTAARRAAQERERLLAELHAEQARLADVFRQSPSFVAVLRGPAHVVAYANDAYTRLVGGRDVVGRPVLDALPELRGQGFDGLLDGVLRTGVPFVGRETPVMLAATPGAPPEQRFVDFVYQPLVEADETRAGVIAHGVDVTDQVRARSALEGLNRQLQEQAVELEAQADALRDAATALEARSDAAAVAQRVAEAAQGVAEVARREAERARGEAQAADQAKTQFLNSMSHELRTPLNAIGGYAQLLDMGVAGPVSDAQRAYLARVTASGQHLLGLVNDVLDLGKLDAGQLAVTREARPASAAVDGAFALVLPQAEARGVTLVDGCRAVPPAGDHGTEDAPPAAYVGDEHRVRQVLVNLLSNAVKFTPRGGTVTVTCAVTAAAPPAVRVAGVGPWARLAVRDTGAGIAPARQAAVFEPFVQADAGTTRQHGGTGLGLTISRRLARLMGGDLTLDSTPGAGTTVTLWLPAPGGAAHGVAGADETAVARADRAQQTVATYRVHGLGEVGRHLATHLDALLEAHVARLRSDPATAVAAQGRTRVDLEDHLLASAADFAQALVTLEGGATDEATLLADGADVQRFLAERHGRQRARLGWAAEQLAREYALLGEELHALVRRLVPEGQGDVTAALAVLDRLVARGAADAARGHRHARTADAAEPAAGNGRPGRGA